MGITFGETVLTKGLNFLLILVLARTLGPDDYGKYSFIFITMALCTALFDFGMENTAVRFTSKEKHRINSIFGLYLGVKLVILAGLILFFALAGNWLFTWMDKPEMSEYIPYLLIGLVGESLFFVNDTYLQARQRFGLRAIFNISRYAVALGYILLLLGVGGIQLEWVFYVYAVPLVFSMAFLGKYTRFLIDRFTKRLPKELFASMVDYERWMFIYSIANNLLGRVDFFLLAFWVAYDQIGIYNAAFQLCAVVSFLPFVMGKVLLPALSEKSREDIFDTCGRVLKTTRWIALAGLLLVPLVPFVVPMLLGADYVAAIPVLQVLLIAFLVGMITMPFEQALYAMGRPKILSAGRYVQLGLIVLLDVVTIPMFGIMAAATNSLVSRVLYLLFVRRAYSAEAKALGEEPLLQLKGINRHVTT